MEVEERVIGGVLNERVGLPESENRNQLRASKSTAKIASSTQLAKIVVYYYRRLIGDDFDCIRSDLMEWVENTLTSCHPKEFRFNKVRFWQHVKKENPMSVLPDLAIRLLSVAVNTATTERLFSEIGMIHTPKRNKMTSAKALDTQCMRQYMRECEQKQAKPEPTVSRTLDPTERPLVNRITQNEQQTESHESPDINSRAIREPVFETSVSAEALPPRTPQMRLRTPIQTPTEQSSRRASQTPIRRTPRQRTPTSQTPIRRSSRRRTPTPQAPQSELETLKDDLDDIGDGVDAEEISPRWKEYFNEVFDDGELGSDFTASHNDDSYRNWEFERIPSPDDTPFPDVDNAMFPQEKHISGIRALKAPLASLFTTNSPYSANYQNI